MRFFTTKTPLKPERTLTSICKDFATVRYLPYYTHLSYPPFEVIYV